jgi:hypothetical protein
VSLAEWHDRATGDVLSDWDEVASRDVVCELVSGRRGVVT